MARPGRSAPNRVVFVRSLTIDEIPGTVAIVLDDFVSDVSGTATGAVEPFSTGGETKWRPTRRGERLPPPKPVTARGDAVLSPMACLAVGFFDIGPVLEAADEEALLLLV